ncbi:selenium-dependent molybdenum cofactor biosynthesis protein YqeB [Sporomusa termitida]|uniref:Selenium-dependent molybdenum hydroxylase system protein, YqeB family n=1 Tax=Sporomusa termitida TaxID=2377 RepID=A0A517DYP8_9FIRM|nr:selenium-dependent molybdenum cofactor biosynthesis protein YqeB [Sporomusa termitida]QDR82507.1 selenium-dependent molybdenum hydroxylase system protein, YqeB family [Sporomusa termitida]
MTFIAKIPASRLVVIRGAGDIATGIAYRLFRSGFSIVMTELAQPTVVRRTVAFAQAIYDGRAEVEGITAVRVGLPEVAATLHRRQIPVLVDPDRSSIAALGPRIVVDAIIAKKNTGTLRSHAPVVIGVGPGFIPGRDVHAVIETMRGHNLGRVLTDRPALPNTGIPGNIGGYTAERVLRAGADGIFQGVQTIGEQVNAGDIVGYVNGQPVFAPIAGTLRGLLHNGLQVFTRMKIGDIDPRCCREHCFTISDKALAIAGGVLEAILLFDQGINRYCSCQQRRFKKHSIYRQATKKRLKIYGKGKCSWL